MQEIAWILAWIAVNAPKVYLVLKPILYMGKTSLDVTKTAQDVFKVANEDLQKATDESASDRTYAAADLIRSYAVFGFLEYLVWITRIVAFLFFIWKLTPRFFHKKETPKA